MDTSDIPQGFLRRAQNGDLYIQPVSVVILPESLEYHAIQNCVPLRSEHIEQLRRSPLFQHQLSAAPSRPNQ